MFPEKETDTAIYLNNKLFCTYHKQQCRDMRGVKSKKSIETMVIYVHFKECTLSLIFVVHCTFYDNIYINENNNTKLFYKINSQW